MVSLIINCLQVNGEIISVIYFWFLFRNWLFVFIEWSIKNIQDVFFVFLIFFRLLEVKVVLEVIVYGVWEGLLVYVGKSKNGYEFFIFN